jgi:uncharacterized iron-regulated membrane protein
MAEGVYPGTGPIVMAERRSWVRHPQTVPWRAAVLQVHLWSGLGLGLYVCFISVTGSVLVYRNELYVAATPVPIVSTGMGPRLSDEQLAEAAGRAHPGYLVSRITRPVDPERAVNMRLVRGDDTLDRFSTRAPGGTWGARR